MRTIWIVWNTIDYVAGAQRITPYAARWKTHGGETDLTDAEAYCARENARRSAGESLRKAIALPLGAPQADALALASWVGGEPRSVAS